MFASLALSLLGFTLGVTAQSTCVSDVPAHSGIPTLYYKPYVPPQIPPISTVWGKMVYETYFAVNCRYATVEKVDDNQPQTGSYNAVTTSATLTLTRIECIQETAAVTRRDRGQASESGQPRAIDTVEAHEHVKRDTNQASILAVAQEMAETIPPDAQGLSLRAYQYLIQVNTALFAINLYNTGFDMNGTCTVLQDPVTQARLYVSSIDPVQAARIICYAAQYGLDFNRSNAQLLSDLLAVIYSIEVMSGFTTNNTEICQTVDFTPLGYLGVDESGVESYLCGSNVTTSTTPTVFTTLVSNTSTALTGTGTAWSRSLTITGTVGTAGSSGIGPHSTATGGASPPYANSTGFGSGASAGTGSLSGATQHGPTKGSSYATATGATGAGSSAAASGIFSIVFPNATNHANSSFLNSGHLPPVPTSSPYYEVWTTSTTSAPRLPRY